MIFQFDIPDDSIKILKNDLLDVQVWIQGMIDGKIYNCLVRAAKEYRAILKAEGASTVPVDDKVAVAEYFARPTYKDRAARDAIQNEKMKLPK